MSRAHPHLPHLKAVGQLFGQPRAIREEVLQNQEQLPVDTDERTVP